MQTTVLITPENLFDLDGCKVLDYEVEAEFEIIEGEEENLYLEDGTGHPGSSDEVNELYLFHETSFGPILLNNYSYSIEEIEIQILNV